MEGALFSLKHKKSPAILLVVVLLMLALIGAGAFLLSRYTWAAGAFRAKNSESLDLRGEELTTQDYEELTQKLPNCDILWDVPFQGGKVSSDSESITLTTLTEQDIRLLGYFPKLRRIDATECTDYALLEELRSAWPELEVSYLVDLGGMKYPPDVTELTLEEGTYDYDTLMLNLVYLPQVTRVTLPNTTLTLEQIQEIGLLYGGVRVEYTVSFRGAETDPGVTELDLSDLTPEEVDQVASELRFFPNLETVELMDGGGNSALSLLDVQKLQEAAPGTTFHYSFSFYGQTLSTTDTEVEYRYKYMKDSDEAEIRQILDVMDSCERFVLNG